MRATIRKWINTIFLVVIGMSWTTLYSQTRAELEKERNAIIEQIELTSKNLEAAEENKKASLKDLKAIEAQIKSRERLIDNIKSQLKNADDAIALNGSQIDSLNQNLITLKSQYQTLVNKAYIKKLAENKWTYILSSDGVNDAFLRWQYLKQFEKYVDQKTQEVENLKSRISNKTNSIKEEKEYIKNLLSDEQQNFKNLEKDKVKKDQILIKLKSQSEDLQKELENKKAEREKLNKAIEKIILDELSKKKSNNSEIYTGTFAKRKLGWPSSGYISGKFGKQKHPTLKNVTINNNGIDITSKAKAPVKAVADGKIISVTSIPGYDKMVIIQHGDFYTVYSKLDAVSVQNGNEVKAGQILGRLKNEASAQLHFELWKEKQKLDPEKWLRKK